MRSQDALLAEDGFDWLKDHAAEHLDRLLDEYAREKSCGLKFQFFELIVAARSPKAIPLFLQLLQDPDELRQQDGVAGLIALGTKEAKQAVWDAGYDPKDNPWDWLIQPYSASSEIDHQASD
jgi:hypothetical protein